MGSTTSERFRLRFNQYKSNILQYAEGKRNMKQVKMISHFFSESHQGRYEDISVQIIDHCDPNDQERREDFWIFHLDTMSPKGLNEKKTSM